MNEEEAEAFENLFKVKVIRDHQKLLKEEDFGKGNVTRTEENDWQRLIKFMSYAFEEGVKKGKEIKEEEE